MHDGGLIYIPILFLGGLSLGSFANVCIYRLPREPLSPAKGRSFCPNCNKLIAWYENIPLASYIFLAGKCSGCSWKIPLRYPLVEFMMGALFALFYLRLGSPLDRDLLIFITGLYIIFTSIVNAFIDIDFMILPDEITLSGIAVAFLLPFIAMAVGRPAIASIEESIVGILLGAGALWIVRILGEIMFKKEAMGLGDVKYMGMLGGIFGCMDIGIILLLASLSGSVIGIIYKLLFKQSYIPFGPFLALAAVVNLFYGAEIHDLFTSFMSGYQPI